MIIFYIDTETTGPDKSIDSIIQLSGIIEVDGKEVETFNWHMTPAGKKKTVDLGATAAHGYTQLDVDNFPDHNGVWEEWNKLTDKYGLGINEKKAYICGFNCHFDFDMLFKWYEDHGDRRLTYRFFTPILDAMELSAIALFPIRPFLPNFKLGTVYRAIFNEDFENAHDSMADVIATKKIWEFCVKNLNVNLSLPDTGENSEQLLFNFEEKPKIPVRQKKN